MSKRVIRFISMMMLIVISFVFYFFNTGSMVYAATIFSDNFDSNNFTAGGWTSNGAIVQNSVRYSNYSCQIPKGASLTKVISTAGYTGIQVQYVRNLKNYTTGDKFISEWYDGSTATWKAIETLSAGSNWKVLTFTLPAGAGLNPDFQLRFRAVFGSTSTANAYLDNVVITGTAATPTPTPIYTSTPITTSTATLTPTPTPIPTSTDVPVITLSSNDPTIDQTINVTISNAHNPSHATDWIGLYEESETPDGSPTTIWWAYLPDLGINTANGTFTFDPSQISASEKSRYFVGGTYKFILAYDDSYTVVASANFTVIKTFTGYFRIMARNSGKFMDVTASSTLDGASVIQYPYNSTSNQQWQINYIAGGYYRFVSRNSNKVLGINGSSTADNAQVVQQTYSGSNSQQWQIIDLGGGYYRFVNRNSNKSVAVSGASTADSANIVQMTSSTGNEQQWQIISTGDGNGLTGEYYDNADLTSFKLKRTDSTINFDWATGSPDTSIGTDTFSVRWYGQLQPCCTGNYTITTNTDDGIRLWIDGQLLINDWTNSNANIDHTATINLIAGTKYDIKMEMFENVGGSSAYLYWSTSTLSREIIPKSQLYTVDYTQGAIAANDAQAKIWISPTVSSSSVNLYYRINSGTTINTVMTNNTATWEYIVGSLNNGDIVDYYFAYEKSGFQYTTPWYTYTHVYSNGTGLTGQYYDNMDLTNLKLTRTDATVNFNWGAGAPDPLMAIETFSVRWVGQVQPIYSETYTFFTNTDDGVRLWVNNNLIIDKWVDQSETEWSGTITLQAGKKYNIKMEYYENTTDATAELLWSSASQTVQIIPQTQLYPFDYLQGADYVDETHAEIWLTPVNTLTNIGLHYKLNAGTQANVTMTNNVGIWESNLAGLNNLDVVDYYFTYSKGGTSYTTPWFTYTHIVCNGIGLTGQYYDNIDLTKSKLTRTDATVNFNWGTGSPAVSIGADTFSVRWTGEVQPLYTENYTFYVASDEGAKLWINGQLIIDKWIDQNQTEWSGSISLTKGYKYDIKLEYYENLNTASIILSWASNSQVKQVIPQSQLYPMDYTQSAEFYSNTQAKIGITPAIASTGVTLHYQINTGSQVNSTMTDNSGTWEGIISGLNNLDQVKYYFTYGKSGTQYDTPWFTYTHVVPTGTGLHADYYDNVDFTGLKFSRTDSTINFDWNTDPPNPTMGADTYSIIWSGYLQPEYTEMYTFYTNVDDGVRLTIGGNIVIDKMSNTELNEFSGLVPLNAGQKYYVRMEYYKIIGTGVAKLSWSSPSQDKQVIPQGNLYPSPPLFALSHAVRTPGGNSYVVGDNVPLSVKYNTLSTISDLVVSIDLDIKKADDSSTGFYLKELRSTNNGPLDTSVIHVFKNGVEQPVESYSVTLDTSGGRKLKVNITNSFVYGDMVEIRYIAKLSATNTVLNYSSGGNYGVKGYLLSYFPGNPNLNLSFEISQWKEGGVNSSTPHSKNTTLDVNEKPNFIANIKVEDPNMLD